MFPSLTKYLLFTSLLFLLGCASAYKDLQSSQGDAHCLQKFIPSYGVDWFTAKVDVTGRHISGLLLIKTMDDHSVRVVFTNEAGIKFFDFKFSGEEFKVEAVMKSLDKKAVINLLRKDFELILMRQVMAGTSSVKEKNKEIYYAFPEKRETVYIVTDKDCSSLLRLERASRHKKKAEAFLVNPGQGAVPDSIHIQHLTFDMQINLKKLER